MEWKIGEIFEYNGEWYQCLESPTCNCKHCDFYDNKHDLCHISPQKCLYRERSDKKDVIFKKLEKVGKPYIIGNKLIQRYKIYPTTYHINVYGWYYHNLDVKTWTIDIEIKQNKEDMEEKKIQLKQEDIDYLTRKIRYLVYKTNDYDRATEEIMNLFIPSDTEHSNSESIEKNLKPFDLEAAKAGKPVCTRDGRKAIFLTTLSNKNFPVVAIVSCGQEENIYQYDIDGVCDEHDNNLDLMMLPEKKEGWAKVRKDINLYDTKEEADRKMIGNDEYVTAKVCWEE